MNGSRRVLLGVLCACALAVPSGAQWGGTWSPFRWWWNWPSYLTATQPLSGQTASLTVQATPITRDLGFTLNGPDDLQGVTNWMLPNGWWYPVSGTNYYSGGLADGGNLYRYNNRWWQGGFGWELIGPTGFAQVPALVVFRQGFWPSLRTTLYGAAGNGAFSDRLIRIDPLTGAGTTVGLFGMQLGRQVRDIQGLAAWRPAMYWIPSFLTGVTGSGFDGTPGDLFSIDASTGQASYIGSLTHRWTGQELQNEVTGLSYSQFGILFGSLGAGDPSREGWLIEIRMPLFRNSTPTFTYVGRMANGPVSDIAFFH